jgi:hypothetical protein
MRFARVQEARSYLLAFGASVEVLDPLALRLTLADFAEQALRVYRDSAAETPTPDTSRKASEGHARAA